LGRGDRRKTVPNISGHTVKGEDAMRKVFIQAELAALALFTGLLLSGCETGTGDTANSAVILEVRNESSVTITDITWSDETFSDGEKTTLTPGGIFTKAVGKDKTGTGHIFFSKSGLPYRTREPVSFLDDYIFTFVDNTIVVDTNDTTNINTLVLIANRMSIPGGVTITASKGRLAVSWTAVEGASFYNVYYGTDTTPPETPAQTNITRNSTIITGLSNGTSYYVWIQAVNTGGVSELSERAEGTPTNAYTVNSTGTFTYAIAGVNNDPGISSYTINVTSDFYAGAVTLTAIGNKTITIRGEGAGRSMSNAAFAIPGGITLELENITLTASTMSVEANGTLVLKSGAAITGAAVHGVFVDGGTVNMTGGTISGNSTSSVGSIGTASESYGAGVYINSGTFTMSDGTISNNSASYSNYYDFTNEYIVKQSYGGGVYINNGTFTMTGGSINGNSTYAAGGLSTTHSYSYGGGVYVNNGTFIMSGGIISGNSTSIGSFDWDTYGGGVYVSGGSFVKTGGTIDGDNVADIGKAVYAIGKKRDATAGPGVNLNSASLENWE
jgi:hypothetical protein